MHCRSDQSIGVQFDWPELQRSDLNASIDSSTSLILHFSVSQQWLQQFEWRLEILQGKIHAKKLISYPKLFFIALIAKYPKANASSKPKAKNFQLLGFLITGRNVCPILLLYGCANRPCAIQSGIVQSSRFGMPRPPFHLEVIH